MLEPGGQLFLTSLVAAGRWLSDRYLALLARAGEIARPRGAREFGVLLARAARGPVRYAVQGNMAYAVLTRS